MALLISRLPRLHDIRAAVAKSTRSHYSRSDLETLFGLRGRAAQKPIGLLPSTNVGTSRLVEREALAGFLDRIPCRRSARPDPRGAEVRASEDLPPAAAAPGPA